MRIKRFISLLLTMALIISSFCIGTISAAPELTSIKINNPGADFMRVGTKLQFSATVAPAEATDFTWKVCEEDGLTPSNKANITADGTLTSNSGGYVTVVASNQSGTVRDSYLMFILQPGMIYSIISKQTAKALIANSDGTGVQLSNVPTEAARVWLVELDDGGKYVKFQNIQTGKYINATSATALSLAIGPSNDNQKFILNGRIPYTSSNYTNYGDVTELGGFRFESLAYSGNVFTSASANEGAALNLAVPTAENSWQELAMRQKFIFVNPFAPAFSLDGFRKVSGEAFGSPEGSYNNDPSCTYDKAFDGNTSTFFDNSVGVGYTGLKLDAPKVIGAVRVYPRATCNIRMFKGFIQGSNDGVNYVNLYEFNSAPFTAAWTEFYLNNETAYSYYRFISANYGFGNVAEIEFYEELDPDAVEITLDVPTALITGDSYKITPVFTLLSGQAVTPDSYSFSSSDDSIASVTADGVVKAISSGSATIKCTAVISGKTWEKSVVIRITDAGIPQITARSFSELPAKTAIYSTIGLADSAFEGNAIGSVGNGNEFAFMVNNLNVKVSNLRSDNNSFDLELNGAKFLYASGLTQNNNQNDQTTRKNNFAQGYIPTSELINNEYSTLKYNNGTNDLFSITVDGSKLHVTVTAAGIAASNTAAGLIIPVSAYIPEKTAVTLTVGNQGSAVVPITTVPLNEDQEMAPGDPIPVNVFIDPSEYPGWLLPVPERKTPMMGWSSWNCFALNITEEKIKGQIDAFVNTGLREAGYLYINIDDGYQKGRDTLSGLVNYDTVKFPKGMKEVADYAHKNGLLAGMYSDAGDNTCGSGASTAQYGNYGFNVGFYDGPEKHPNEQRDAPMYMHDWGYDFIKVDWCGGGHANPGQEQQRYTSISNAVKKVGEEDGSYKIFNICRWTFPGAWAVDVADSWRTSGDITATWDSILYCLDTVKALPQYAGPGHVNDPDMLEVGNGSLTYDQNKSHFSMWCMVASPLALGNDLRTISDETLSILTNKEIIAIDQDPAVIQATVIKTIGANGEVWARDLGKANSNVKAVALFNRGATPLEMSVDFAKDLGFNGEIAVRDLWLHEEVAVDSSYSATVPPYGIVVLKVTGGENSSVSNDLLNATLTEAPANVDLTAEGLYDWKAFATNARKSGGNLIVDNNTGNTSVAFGTSFAWTNAEGVAEGSSSAAVALTEPGSSYEVSIPSGLGPAGNLSSVWTLYNGVSTQPTDQYEITTTLASGDIYASNSTDAVNLYYMDPPAGDFEAVVKVTSNFTSSYPSVGLIAWVDKDNYVSMLRRYHSGFGNNCFMLINEANASCNEPPAATFASLLQDHGIDFSKTNEAYLKLVRSGDTFSGYVSIDGINWILVATKTNATVANNSKLKIGLFSNGSSSYTVKYNDFKLNGNLIPFSYTTDNSAKLYLGANNARVKVESVYGDKSSVSYIDSSDGEKDAVYNVGLYTKQALPLKLKVTLDKVYGDGSALVGAAAIGAKPAVDEFEEYFYVSDYPTTGMNIDLDKAGQLDWVTFGTAGVRKQGGDYLGGFTKSSSAAISDVASKASYTANGVSLPAGVSQSEEGSFFEVVLPPSEGLKKADIYFGAYKAEAAISVSKGDDTYNYGIFDAEDGQGSVVSVWYSGIEPVRVLISLTAAFSPNAYLSLDAVSVSNVDYVIDPQISYSDGVLTVNTKVANYSGSSETIKALAAVYEGDTKLASLDASVASGLSADGDFATVDKSIELSSDIQNGILKLYFWDDNFVPVDAGSQSYDLPYSIPETDYAIKVEQSYIGTLTAKSKVNDGAKLIDVRTAAEYEAGHIEGAYNAPVGDLLNTIASIVPNKTSEIVLYCGNAYSSLIARRILYYAGYTNVYVLGSMTNWDRTAAITMSPTNLPDQFSDSIVKIRYENISIYDPAVAEVLYSLGADSTINDAIPYPSEGIALTQKNVVKAYLKYGGLVVAQAETSYDPYIAEPIPAVTPSVYASDMTWVTVTQGWGTTRRDTTIDNAGRRLTIAGTAYTKGIGTHASGAIEIKIPEGAKRFISVAGVDDEVGQRSNRIKFFVYVDDVLVDQSHEITVGQYKLFDIDLTGYTGADHIIKLVCDETSDGKDYDHADWAISGFVVN